MKHLMMMAGAGLLVLAEACAQNQKEMVPDEAQSAFRNMFPNASKIGWEKENEDEWEVEFAENGVEYSANFSTTGEWKETEHEIQLDEVPDEVRSTLDSAFSGYKVKEAERAEKMDGISYEFELKKGKTVVEVAISAEGRVIHKQEVEEESDDED